jgi:hypothetical protein
MIAADPGRFRTEHMPPREAFDAGWGTLSRRALVFLVAVAMGSAFSAGPMAQTASAPRAQLNPNSDWETAAGGPTEFEVISIHPEKNSDADSSVNVPSAVTRLTQIRAASSMRPIGPSPVSSASRTRLAPHSGTTFLPAWRSQREILQKQIAASAKREN